MTTRYHYIVTETRKHGLTIWAYGIFRGKDLISHECFVSPEMAHATGRRIADKLNNAIKQAA